MSRIKQDTFAPDFTLPDHQGQQARLSDYRGQKNVLLVFNRGFV